MLVFLFIFTLSAILIFGTYHYLKQLRKQMIFKLLERNLLCNLSLRNWYSSTEILRLAKELNKYSKESLSPIFMNLRNGDLSSLIKIYQKDTLMLICGRRTKTTNSLVKAELSLLDFDYKKAFVYAKNLRANNDDEKARLLLVEAKIALNEGDMDTASRKTALAIKLFQKLGFIFEEASAYLLYGTIYRATGISDTAQIMLQTSADLFRNINAKSAEAEVYGNMGMLMVMDKRFDEANDYFEKATAIFETIGDIDNLVNIYNQKALTMLINNDPIQATNWIKKSLSCCGAKNIRGLSVCYDIYAQIVFAKKQLTKTISLANKAISLYVKTGNVSAKLEMMYLIAQVQIKQGHLSIAEKTLRKLIDEAQNSQSCFHIANAYSLLGILFLQKKEFSRAKGLFNQSLQSELNNERWCGVAVDYANIALTEYRRGRKAEGNKNKISALKYAEESGDEKLITLLNSALNVFES